MTLRYAMASAGARMALLAGTAIILLGAADARAHLGHDGEHPAQAAGAALEDDGHDATDRSFGGPGDMTDVTRTIEIEAGDVFFEPSQIDVRAGETVRLVITNTGDIVHEFTLGPPSVQESHRAEMTNLVQSGLFDGIFLRHDLAHHDWNAVLLNPQERRVVVWTMPDHGAFEFGCNVPGHYEAGMVGSIVID